MKHNKIKNTGLIFEILSRLVMRETLDGQTTALSLVKKHFKQNSELVKELKLYQSLCQPTAHNPNELLDLTIKSKRNLNKAKLAEEKYQLIRSINSNYIPDVFFKTKTTNYRLTASIFKLLEYDASADPDSFLSSKKMVIETLTGSNIPVVQETEMILRQQDSDIRKLSFKLIVEKFNEKYRSLGPRQKTLLQNYINEDINKPDFKDYVVREVSYIVESLNQAINRTSDEIVKIKLNEVIQLTQSIVTSRQIKEEHLGAMLKYYELIDEMKKTNQAEK